MAIMDILEKYGNNGFDFQHSPLITEAQKKNIISTFANDARETALEIDDIFSGDRERGASDNGEREDDCFENEEREDDCFETLHKKLQDFVLFKIAKQATLGMLIQLKLMPKKRERRALLLLISGVDMLVEDYFVPACKKTFTNKRLSKQEVYFINSQLDQFIWNLTSIISFNLKVFSEDNIAALLKYKTKTFLTTLAIVLQGELNKNTNSEVNTALREIKEVFAQHDTTANSPLVSLKKSPKVAAAKPYHRELEIPLSSSEDSKDRDSKQDEDGEQEKLGYREIKEVFAQHDTTANAPLVSLKKSPKVAAAKPYHRELEIPLSSSEDSEDRDSKQDEDSKQEKLGYNWNKDLFMILATTLVNC